LVSIKYEQVQVPHMRHRGNVKLPFVVRAVYFTK